MKELVILTIEQIRPDNEKASYHPVILKSNRDRVLEAVLKFESILQMDDKYVLR